MQRLVGRCRYARGGPDGISLSVSVPNPLPKGECVVAWQVSQPDGTSGGSSTFLFTIANDTVATLRHRRAGDRIDAGRPRRRPRPLRRLRPTASPRPTPGRAGRSACRGCW